MYDEKNLAEEVQAAQKLPLGDSPHGMENKIPR
jgi:hypothetical protein